MEHTVFCQLTQEKIPIEDAVPVSTIRESIKKNIRKKNPTLDDKGYVSIKEFNLARNEYIQQLLEEEHGELSKLDIEVLKSIANADTLAKNINEELTETLSYGQKIADRVASFGGSWRFIISFGIILFIWILFNSIALAYQPFDPYPFILLNLVLSCIAALQAPVIMMSQNRQEEKDRLRAQNDYMVNLKAELEIRQLHEKIDHLLIQQGHRFMEIQQIQIDLMEQILEKKK